MSDAAVPGTGWNLGARSDARMPPRPAIPPVLWCAASIWAGISVAEQASWGSWCGTLPLPQETCSSMAVALFAAACLLAGIRLFICKRDLPLPALAAVALLAAAATGCLYWQAWESSCSTISEGISGRQQYAIISDAHEGAYGPWSEARLLMLSGQPRIRVYWSNKGAVMPAGSLCTAYGKIAVPSHGEPGRRMHQQGCCGSVTLRSVKCMGWDKSIQGLAGPVRSWARQVFAAASGDGAAMLMGVVLGDRGGMTGTACEKAFKACGLSHLLAVSGSHLVVVGALFGWLLGKAGMRKAVRSVLLFVALVAYIFLSGVQVSAIRACAMTACALAGSLAGRRAHPATALGATTCVMLLAQPDCAFSFGFALSVLAVTGIILIAPLIASWSGCILPSACGDISSALSLTLAAQAATLALTVPAFSQLPLVSPLANIIVAPLVTALLGGGMASLALSALLPGVGALAVNACAAFGNGTAELAIWLAGLPFASIAVSWPAWACAAAGLGGSVAAWVLWPKPERKTAAALAGTAVLVAAAALAAWSFPPSPRIVMLDVGQGDSMLVQDGGSTVLIDTGEYPGKLLEGLARNHVSHIDAVIITHLHADHYLALSALGSTVHVDQVLFARPALAGQQDSEAIQLALGLVGEGGVDALDVGDVVSVGGFMLKVLSPSRYIEKGGNQDSLCFEVAYSNVGSAGAEGGASIGLGEEGNGSRAIAMLTGDAESGVLSGLESSGMAGEACVLKVGHHGSSAALDEESLDAVSPQVALISVGEGNDYGHPAPATLGLLAQHGIPVYRTDRDGDITATVAADSIDITCANMGAALLAEAA